MAIQFKATWTLPDGASCESWFSLEPAAPGWDLYKREYGGEEWYKVTPSLQAQVQRIRQNSRSY